MLTVCCAKTVSPSIAATKNDHVLAFCMDLVDNLVAGLHPVRRCQIVHCWVNTTELAARNCEVTRNRGTRCHDDCVVAFGELTPSDVDTDSDTRPKPGSLLLHLSKTHIKVVLFHLEIGYSITQKPTDAVISLEYGDRVPDTGQLLRGCQASRATSHYRHCLSRQALWWQRLHPAVLPRVVDDGHFNVLDRDRWLVDPQHTRRFAGRWTQAPSELREVVGLVEALDSTFSIATTHEVVPLRDEVSQWATVVAEGDSAVHTA